MPNSSNPLSTSQTINPTSYRETGRDDYRPISGLAIAAIICTIAFVLCMGVMATIAMVNNKLFDDRWPLMLALSGFILSILASFSIRNSENTRAGMTLATLSWWICVLGGAGFFAYIMGADYTVREDSRKVIDEWFKLLEDGKINMAFVQTLDPGRQATVNPDDKAQLEADFGPVLQVFYANPIVSLYRRYDKSLVKHEAMGTKATLVQDKKSVVLWSYNISCPEGVFQCSFRIIGEVGKGSLNRRWWLELSPNMEIKPLSRTTYGYLAYDGVMMEGGKEAILFIRHVTENRPYQAFLATLPPNQRIKNLNQFEAIGLLASQAASQTLAAPYLSRTLPDGFFQLSDGSKPSPAQLEDFKRVWNVGHFLIAGSQRISPRGDPRLELANDRLILHIPIDVALNPERTSYSRTILLLELKEPELAKKIAEAFEDAKMHPGVKGDSNSQKLLPKFTEDSWQFIGFQTDLKPIAIPIKARQKIPGDSDQSQLQRPPLPQPPTDPPGGR